MFYAGNSTIAIKDDQAMKIYKGQAHTHFWFGSVGCHSELGAAVARDQQSQGAVEGGSAVAGPIAAMSATADIVTNFTSSYSKKFGCNKNNCLYPRTVLTQFTKHLSRSKDLKLFHNDSEKRM